MNQASKESLPNFYNMLLEAERAGVTVLQELVSQTDEPQLSALLKKFLQDEGLNCRILISLIRDLGAEPSNKTGAFVDKVRALDNLKDKIDLLIRGQAWVARKIEEFRFHRPGGSSFLFMEAVKVQHQENVDALKAFRLE